MKYILTLSAIALIGYSLNLKFQPPALEKVKAEYQEVDPQTRASEIEEAWTSAADKADTILRQKQAEERKRRFG